MSATWSSYGTTAPYNVHLGTWTNWSRGRIFGATLTLNREAGNLLIAFTAFFVGLVASRFWRVLCLSFHRCYSTPEPRDALHHQRQAVLRNSASADNAFWAIGQLLWAWNRSAKDAMVRLFPLLLFSVACLCAFTLASGFSSRVSTGIGNQVLIDGANCGLLNTVGHGAVTTVEAAELVKAYRSNLIQNAADYAQQCYSNSSGVFDCKTFAVSAVPGAVDTAAPCPFEDEICRSNTSNIRLDTGYLDARAHFGLNTPDDQNILFRNVFHCAPLVTNGYSNNFIGENETYTRYYYGGALTESYKDNSTFDYTYEVPGLDSQYMREWDNFQRNLGNTFRVVSLKWSAINGTTNLNQAQFIPIPELYRPEGDVYLIFLVGNGVLFGEQSTDAWYRITLPYVELSQPQIDWNSQGYIPEEAASPMGCVEQYQICNANQQCGPLAGFYDAVTQAAPAFGLAPDDIIRGTAKGKAGSKLVWFANTMSIFGAAPGNVLVALGAQALNSIHNIQGGVVQASLAANQWQLDVTHWWTTWLASLQAAYVSAATGIIDPKLIPYRLAPADEYQWNMCYNQIIQSTQYTSFSLFGLVFVLATGAVIILISYGLEPLFDWLQLRHHYQRYKYLEWTSNETLHLQCLSYQGLGRGNWSRYIDAIPMTERGEMLEPLAVDLEKVGIPFGASETLPKSQKSSTNGETEDGNSQASSVGTAKNHLCLCHSKESEFHVIVTDDKYEN